jgi:hypothetical protein
MSFANPAVPDLPKLLNGYGAVLYAGLTIAVILGK